MPALRIFLGTLPGHWVPSEVLKHSIRRRTQAVVTFEEVRTFPLNFKTRINLGLALHPFYIPEFCGGEGKALYLDGSQICLADIGELFQLDMGQKGALALPMHKEGAAHYTSVMLFDSAKLKHWKLEEWVKQIDLNPALLREFVGITQQAPFTKDFGNLPPEWNVFETFVPGTKLLSFKEHFNLPWMSPNHPAYPLFAQELSDALKQGVIPQDALQREIAWGHIYDGILQ